MQHKDNTDKVAANNIELLLHPGIDQDPAQFRRDQPQIRGIIAVKMNMVIIEMYNVKIAEKISDLQHITQVEQAEAQVMAQEAHGVVFTILEAEKRDNQAGHYLCSEEVEEADINSIM